MASVNKVIVLGNVGNDPEMRYAQSGDAIVNVSIATTRRWKNKDGEKQEETEWHRVSAFGRLAEIIGEYVHKGDPLFVSGRLRTRKWTDKEGVERYTTEIVAEEIQLLGNRSGGESREPQRREPPPRREPPKKTQQQEFDDDIPF
ncbi:MAG TPA: single-stranded DNA-binding protein [Candidatus Krumholzibacteria bacterium]|nr:single-stranded DNA-binding protein [Candidatus Krumholzibacteria bacterium]